MQDKLKLSNKEPFNALVISPNSIKDKDWKDPNYLNNLVNDKYCNYIKINPNNYEDDIGDNLTIDKYTDPNIKVQIIYEEKNYLFELMYVELTDTYDINEFATLLNINGDTVYGNAIITRTYISITNNDMYFDNLTSDVLKNMMHRRANTNVIVYDSDNEAYEEIPVFGPLDDFSDNFFSEYKYKITKVELGFLKHNINIWYSEDKYGILDVCGNLIPELARVNKMIIFSMRTDTYRDSISLEEFHKIIVLSKKLKSYDLPDDYMNDEKDELDRLIIKNKHKILHEFFEKYKN